MVFMAKSGEDKSIKDKVHELVTRNFSITKCPEAVYEDFVKFAKEETSDNYSMALKMLIEGMKANIKEVHLYEQYMELKAEFAEFKESILVRLDNLEKKDKPKTFGTKK